MGCSFVPRGMTLQAPARRAGVGLEVGWALFAARNPWVQSGSGLASARTELMGPALCPASPQLRGSAGLAALREAGPPGFLKEWIRLPGLDSSAFYRHPQGSAKNGRKRGGPASAQLWLLLFSPGGSCPRAGLSGGPSAARRRLRRGSAVSLQHDVTFPGPVKRDYSSRHA